MHCKTLYMYTIEGVLVKPVQENRERAKKKTETNVNTVK